MNQYPKTRNDIITSMCYTWNHAYGAGIDPNWPGLGYTDGTRLALWNQMAQLFDNDIAPFMEFSMEVRPAPMRQEQRGK